MTIAPTLELKKSHSFNGSAEHRLILACARCQPNIALISSILDDCAATFDWDRFVQIALWHGVLPLVYRNLSTLVPYRVPKATLGQLMTLYLQNSTHNQRLTSALQELVEVFKTQGIPILFFKGPVLSEVAYGSIHLRRFSDIDLLVRQADVPVVRQILMGQGFQTKEIILAAMQENDAYQEILSSLPAVPKDLTRHDLEAEAMDHSGEEMFIHEENFVTVDLHWQLTPSYFPVAFDLNQIWHTRQSFTVDQSQVDSLNPQDLLLYLCTHGSKELWRNLIWVCDVAEVVRVYPDLPWLELWERSKTLKIERMFLLGLALAHKLLEMPIPLPLQAPVLHHPEVQDLLQVFTRRFFADIETLIETRETGFWLFHNPIHFKLRDRLRDRLPQYWLTFCFIITPNAEDQQFLSLPKGLYRLHYLVRPIRIFYKWIILRKSSTAHDRENLTPI
jgi:Uncharacterised nucleotidyltransferase